MAASLHDVAGLERPINSGGQMRWSDCHAANIGAGIFGGQEMERLMVVGCVVGRWGGGFGFTTDLRETPE